MGYKEAKAKAIAEKTAVIIKADFLKMDEEGMEIVGRYLTFGFITPASGGAEYKKYRFDTDDGAVEFAPGGVFDNGAGMEMKTGKVYSVTYLGKVRNAGGHQMNTFEVMELPE